MNVTLILYIIFSLILFMVIRIEVFHEESKKKREVTTEGDFYEIHSKILDLIKEHEKNERRSQIEDIGIYTDKIRLLLYSHPKLKSGNVFNYKLIYKLIEEETDEEGIKLTSDEKGIIRAIIDRLSKNESEMVERVQQRSHFRIIQKEKV